MKKLVALQLAVVLCLIGCSSVGGDEGGKVAAPETLCPGANVNHPFLQNLLGRWDYFGDYPDSYPFSQLEIFEDGTCHVDGRSGVWLLNERTTDHSLYVDILVGEAHIATVSAYFDWNEQFELSFPDLPVNPGDRWINAEAAFARNEMFMQEWGSDLYGKWEIFDRDCVGMIESPVFCEDGTVTIGEKGLSWMIDDNQQRSETELDLLVYEGEDKLYDMKLWRQEGDLHGQLFDGSQYIVLYKPSYYEIISITAENIFDYFEFTTVWSTKYNGFDELEQVTTKIDLVLKEPWASRISYVNDDTWEMNTVDNGAIELSYQLGSFDVILHEDETFTLENCVSSMTCSDIYDGNGSFSGKTYHFNLPYSYRIYQPGRNLDVEQWIAHESHSYFDYQVVRVKLDLYLIPEK